MVLAERYSPVLNRNNAGAQASEYSLKGMNEKVRNGGSVGRAPIGYLNVRKMENGHEIRTVEIDQQRAELVKWAFEAYAQDGWTARTLTDELNRRGLTTVPTPKMAEGPVGIRQISGMLNNPFYTGVVHFKGALFPGSHEPLISTTTFETVQSILKSRLTGERSRKHAHYLKSTVFCGNCDSRLMYQRNRSTSTGEIYDYYACTGRHAKRTDCDFRSIQIYELENKIAALYQRITLKPGTRQNIEVGLKVALKEMRRDEDEERQLLEATLQRLRRKQEKLLEAHFNDAISIDLLKDQQKKIDIELATAQRDLARHHELNTSAEELISDALAICENSYEAYLAAPEQVRRMFNQIFFEKIKVRYDQDEVAHVLEPVFSEAFTFLGNRRLQTASAEIALHLAATAVSKARQEKGTGTDEVTGSPSLTQGTQPRKTKNLVIPDEVSYDLTDVNPLTYAIGSCKSAMVDLRGLEPLTPCMPCRCATSCATDPWKSGECSPDNPSSLLHPNRLCANQRSAPIQRETSITGQSFQSRSSW